MQKCIVRIADGSPETGSRLTNFRSQMKLKDPLKKITMGGSIDDAIEQAEPQTEDYSCSNCGRGIGPFSADRSLELYGGIWCGKCLHEMAEARREEEDEAQEKADELNEG